MTVDLVVNWLYSAALSTAVIGFFAFLLRDSIAKFLTKSIDHRFEQKIEIFKAGIRESEKEVDHIRTFLTSIQKDKNSTIQAKRLESAEALLKSRDEIAKLSIVIEYMKSIDSNKILESKNDPKIINFIETLARPIAIDERLNEYNKIDKTLPNLYLSEKTLKTFKAYEAIILQAALTFKLLTVPIDDKKDLIRNGIASEKIIELVPDAKAGFDEHGDNYAYYWSSYFHGEILKLLRQEVPVDEDLRINAASIEKISIDSYKAHINIRDSLVRNDISSSILRKEVSQDLNIS